MMRPVGTKWLLLEIVERDGDPRFCPTSRVSLGENVPGTMRLDLDAQRLAVIDGDGDGDICGSRGLGDRRLQVIRCMPGASEPFEWLMHRTTGPFHWRTDR